MRFYTLILCSALFVLSTSASAQHTFTFEFDSVYHIDDPNKCNHLTVYDMRESKDDMGVLKTGALNRVTPIITEQPLPDFLSSYYKKMVKGKPKGADDLVLVLYHLSIEDRPNGDEMGTFYFDGDFYKGKDNQYSFTGKVDSIFEVKAAFDVTKKLVNASQLKIADIFSHFAIAAIPAGSTAKYTNAQMQDRRKQEKLTYPIYQTEKFKKGIYYTVDQFINNQPVDTPIIRDVSFINGERKEIFFHYQNERGKKGKRVKDNTFFAVYDGTAWALSNGYYCVPMEYKNGDFYANKAFQGLSTGTNMAGAMFGLTGALIAAAASSDKNHAWALYRSRFDPAKKDFVPMKRLR